MPFFEKAVRVGDGFQNIQVSYVNEKPHILMGQKNKAATEFVNFRGNEFNDSKELTELPVKVGKGKIRAKQWKYVYFNGDNVLDLIYGVGFLGNMVGI
ncbi:hypothetical protein [Yeosuana marina]|uniref:hypothetical protein n=1 Tax=Yeosuana marina TaxID=1565536 RepID=UPI0030C81578